MYLHLFLLVMLLFGDAGRGRVLDQLSEAESRVFAQVNEYRRSQGLSPLDIEASLMQEARKHSKAMAAGRVRFGHEGFQERIRNACLSYRAAAENVALNKGVHDPSAHAVQGWIRSSGHRSNMEGDFNLTGVGIAQARDGTYYFTQIFLRTR